MPVEPTRRPGWGWSAALFTENIYRPLIRPGRSEKHYVLVGRLTSLAWQMLIYLSIAAVVMVAVSLFTRPPAVEKLDSIYATLRTPVTSDEPEVAPLTLPEGTEPAPRDPLSDLPGFEIMKPSVSGVVGFLACSALVAALIWFFAWILG